MSTITASNQDSSLCLKDRGIDDALLHKLVFHACMDDILRGAAEYCTTGVQAQDSHGRIVHAVCRLACIIADRKEHEKYTLTRNGYCWHCWVDKDDMGKPYPECFPDNNTMRTWDRTCMGDAYAGPHRVRTRTAACVRARLDKAQEVGTYPDMNSHRNINRTAQARFWNTAAQTHRPDCKDRCNRAAASLHLCSLHRNAFDAVPHFDIYQQASSQPAQSA